MINLSENEQNFLRSAEKGQRRLKIGQISNNSESNVKIQIQCLSPQEYKPYNLLLKTLQIEVPFHRNVQ